MSCSIFAQRYCESGEIRKEFYKFASSKYNNPAENCCECGKQINEETSKPIAPPADPTVTYDKCTNHKVDDGNWRIEEYCASIGDDFLSCNTKNGDYCQQRCGKGNEKIKITLPPS